MIKFITNIFINVFLIFQAVTIAQIPYWILRNPSEVIKTRLRTKMQFTTEKSENTVKNQNKELKIKNSENTFINNFRDLYSGIGTNLMYALPSDWLKFLSYEFISKYLFGITIGQGKLCSFYLFIFLYFSPSPRAYFVRFTPFSSLFFLLFLHFCLCLCLSLSLSL
jgi:Mitochondrial carrier protein